MNLSDYPSVRFRAGENTTLIPAKQLYKSKHQIYLAFDESNPKKAYAVKVFNLDSKGSKINYLKEKKLADLSHPNIIKQIYSCDQMKIISSSKQESNIAYTVTEYMPNGDLESQISKDNDFFEDETLIRTYFHYLIDALEYLQSKKIAHLDLKLENIVIGNDLKPKLIDFDSFYQQGDVLILSKGTRSYRAPEMVESECEDASKADIYSLGVILYAMRFGSLPYNEFSAEELVGVRKDPSFDLLKSGDMQKFWEFKSKSAEYVSESQQKSSSFRTLFESMVCKNPSKRASISDIKKSVWYKGPVYEEKEMKIIMEELLSSYDID